MPFITTHKILEEYATYGFFGLIVYGPLRSGKSVFTVKLLAEIFGIIQRNDWKTMITRPFDEWNQYVDRETKLDWEAWKKWMVFLPEEWMEAIDSVEGAGEQHPMIVWDDAGLWASAYRWADDFGKAVNEYVNVAATDFASVCYTTPDPRWLLTHIRQMPGGHNARVIKTSGNIYDYSRRLKVYEGWITPDFKKGGVTSAYIDNYNCRLPDDVYNEYNVKRRTYTKIAKQHLREVIAQIRANKGEKAANMAEMEFQVKAGFDLAE